MLRRLLLLYIALSLWLFAPIRASAVLTIEITGGVEAGMPIAVVPFEWRGQGAPPVDLRNVIAADLHRSGRFDVLPVEDFLSRPSDNREVRYKDWRLIKAEALVVGRVKALSGNRFEVRFQLFDVFREKQLAGYRWEVDRARLRKVAHQASDHIVKTLTGKGPAFDSRIAYVTVEQVASKGPTYRLMVADSDGFSPREILLSSDPILSPAWSPDGQFLAYVSFEDGWSKVVLQEVDTGNRLKMSEYPGINGAPAWSPDGRQLALSLSHEGNSEIYVMNIKNRQLQRLTRHSAIDTEPAWAPNGRSIIFTSDRSGRPQIYRVPTTGGKAVRLTFEGRENSRGSISPDGKNLLLVTNDGNGHQIGVFSMSNKRLRTLTSGPFDESPTFAPNGAMALYATKRGGRELLEVVSADGRARQALRFQQGAVRSPAWSPVNR
jgi:TolB protein